MDFSTITNISLFTKMQFHKNKGNSLFTVNNRTSQTLSPVTAAQQQQSDPMTAIMSKMDSGLQLSPEELEYLRENAPQLYEEAVKLAKEREAYKEELRRCKTKEDARLLHLTKLAPLLKNADIKKAVMLNTAFTKFTMSNEYAAKLENYLEMERAYKAELEQTSNVKKKDTSKSEETEIFEIQAVEKDNFADNGEKVQPNDGTEQKPFEHSEKPQSADSAPLVPAHEPVATPVRELPAPKPVYHAVAFSAYAVKADAPVIPKANYII